MNLATYAGRNLFRRKGRTILTLLAVAVAVLIFSLIRTSVVSWNAGAEAAAVDRLATLHKTSITQQLPKHYIDDVRGVPGVKAATYANWFGAKDPKKRVEFFAGMAADHESFFDVMDEMIVTPEALAEWKKTPNGAIVGDVLARKFGLSVGDKLVINSDIYDGDWEFKVVGIYQAKRPTVDRQSLIFRWDYLNNDPRAEFSKEQIGWMFSRIADPTKSAEISKQIDKLFEERDDQTETMSERAFQLSWLGAFAAVLTAFDIVSAVILLIMTLILANAIAMSVRERVHEYGILRAIGFRPGHILGFILGEAVLVALVGGALGLLLTIGMVNGVLGPWIEENMGAIFIQFHTPVFVMGLAIGLAVLLGIIAGLVPAIGASRRKVTDALRRID